MMLARIVLLLLLLTPPPTFTAVWDSNSAATISWTAPTHACLSVLHATGERAFIGCWEGGARIQLGRAPTDGTARPSSGDIYVLQVGGGVYRAPLVGRPVYVALIR